MCVFVVFLLAVVILSRSRCLPPSLTLPPRPPPFSSQAALFPLVACGVPYSVLGSVRAAGEAALGAGTFAWLASGPALFLAPRVAMLLLSLVSDHCVQAVATRLDGDAE